MRRNLVRTVATLISLGADVNAVGKNDVMPLNIAQGRKCDIEDSEDVALITKMLEENGAKASVKELLRGGSGGSTTTVDNSPGSGFSFSTSAGMPFTTNSMVSVSSGASSDRPAGGSGVYGDSLQGEPKKAPGQATAPAAPVMASATGGGGSSNNFVRFTGGAGGPAPVVVSDGPKTVFTSFSSSTQELNRSAVPVSDSSQRVNVLSSGAGGQRNEGDAEKMPDSKAYSKASDDGGMMFSTS